MTSTSYTPSQIKAIHHDRGNLILFAVAGSGKTTVLVQRIKRLAALDKKLLVLTFSKKAAESLIERVGRVPNMSFIGTFHSFCFNAMRKRRPDLYVGKELLKPREDWLLVAWAEEILRGTRANMDPADLIRLMGRLKTYGYHPSTWGTLQGDLGFDGVGPYEIALSADLNAKLHGSQKYTFDDMLVDCLHELNGDPEFAKMMRDFFDHVMVDEFQDTDPCQANILKHITGDNLCVVGDDDQAIYAFRGCSPDFIMRFEEYYGDGDQISMEENFRSEDQILELANKLIQHNENRVPKTLVTTRGTTGAVRAIEVMDGVEEARLVADLVAEHIDKGAQHRDIAVLYRTNAQSGAFEDEFAERRIPFEVAEDDGGFYSRTEIRTLVSYLRILHDPTDVGSLRWILNRPTRYLRREWLTAATTTGPDAVLNTLYAMSDKGSMRQQDATKDLIDQLKYLMEMARAGRTPYEIVSYLWQWLNYDQYLQELAARSPRRILQEYADATARFVGQTVPRFNDLRSLLYHIDLVEAENRKKKEDRDAVLFSTIHRSKGLEFPVVILVGANTDLLPHKDAVLEEERRLTYVAVTRAIQTLYITTYGTPSRFFKEMGLVPETQEDEQLQHQDSPADRLDASCGVPGLPEDEIGVQP